jgi:hypothetical protein
MKIHGDKTHREWTHPQDARAHPVKMAHSATVALKRLPAAARCRTQYLRFCDLSECLMNPQPLCEHGLRLGFRIFCFHPQRRVFELSESRR